MRVAVTRGDLPGPLFLADLEVISQYDPAIEPVGQTFYISRPILSEMATAMAGAQAGLLGTVNMTSIGLPITIGAGNRALKVRTSVAPTAFTTCNIAMAAYATVAALMVAVNAALVAGGVAASVSLDRTGTFMVLKSTATGPGAYIEVDSVAGGSTFNSVPGIAIAGGAFTMPTAAAVITALNPVGGPLDVSNATLLATLGGGLTDAQALAVADAVSLKLVETQVVVRSFQVGNLAGYRSANYTPDANRLPDGAAITVVQDDGVSLYTAPVPNITSAVIGGGNLTITGTGLGSNETFMSSIKTTGACAKTLDQRAIKHAGGTISATSIVVPLTALPGLAAATCWVQVKMDTLLSNVRVVA
jgi:hypothetical protein